MPARGWVVARRFPGSGSVIGGLMDRLVIVGLRLIHCGSGWMGASVGERCDDVA